MGSRRFRHGPYIETNKYRSDIGSRLSGAYLPTTQARDTTDSVEDTFCMLTIDTRHHRRLKDNSQVSSRKEDSTVRASIDGSPTSQKKTFANSDVVSVRRTVKECETFQCWKVSLRKKLTQVLFQKRHTCCRCKRRSRNCVRNKTFNGIEKHYTCCRCRESSKAVHNLFGGKSSFVPVQSACTHSSLRWSAQENNHTVQQTLATDASQKDSGYGTVTSCSTVASSCSASTSPVNNNLIKKSSSAVKCSVKNCSDLWCKANTTTMCQPLWEYNKQFTTSCVTSKQDMVVSYAGSNNDIKSCVFSKRNITAAYADANNDIIKPCVPIKEDIIASYDDSNNDIVKSCTPLRQDITKTNAVPNDCIIKSCAPTKNDVKQLCVPSNNDTRTNAPSNLSKSPTELVNKTTGVSNILVAAQQNHPFGVIRQINQRRIDEYDGYLPEEPTNKLLCLDIRDQIPPSTTDMKASVQNDCPYTMKKLPELGRDNASGNRTCYTCGSTFCKVLFRLPWEGGFVCEDCLDRLY